MLFPSLLYTGINSEGIRFSVAIYVQTRRMFGSPSKDRLTGKLENASDKRSHMKSPAVQCKYSNNLLDERLG